MIRSVVYRAVIACVVLLVSVAGSAQETTGTILGVLVDKTGGVLAGVKVVIVSVDTDQKRETVTDRVGRYSTRLPIGNYEIQFVLPKFLTYTANGITLHVNDRLQVNATLDIEGAVETLTVTAQRLVQPLSAVQSLIQPAAVHELPLLNRNFRLIATLVPGVSSDLREEGCFCDQGNLNVSINGARRSAVNWLLDGASNVNGWTNYTLDTTPSLEVIKEINVITSSYSAEWARNGGGVVNVVTKSGSNRFAGSVYEFLRNDSLSAVPFLGTFDSKAYVNHEPARLHYNNFGFTAGGPALPKHEKVFFFLSQEWRRGSGEKKTFTSISPDPAWLTDPANPNYVPMEERDPNAVKLLTLWPSRNIPGNRLYRTTFPAELDTSQQFVRADYNVSADWSLTGRYLGDRVDALGDYVTADQLPGHRARVGHLTGVEARRAGRSLLHEMSYQMSSNRQSPEDRLHTRSDLGIAIPEYFPENAANLIPTVSVAGLSRLWGEQRRLLDYLNQTVSAATTWQHGNHTVKGGGLVAFERVSSNLSPQSTQGEFDFEAGGGFTAFQNFLRGNRDGACGEACNYSEADVDVINRFRTTRYEVYLQDTWRLRPTITLDAGVRYALSRPVTDDSNRLFTFSPDAYNRNEAPAFADADGFYLVPGTGDIFNGIQVAGKNSPYGRAIYPADTNNVQPRLGVAWDPATKGRLVVRAGYGLYFDELPVGIFAENVQNSTYDPFRSELLVANPSLSNPASGTVTTSPLYTPWLFATSERLVAPRWQHWNIGIQRRLYSHGVIDAGFVGSRGDHLLWLVDVNQPQPADVLSLDGSFANPVRPFLGYDFIRMRETTASSRYHGVLTSFRHENAHGLSAVVNYTFSRTNTDATYDNALLDSPQNPLDMNAQLAAAQTDRAHIFNAYYVYELPFSSGEDSGWKGALLAGWQIAGVTWIESGPAVRLQVVNCNYGGSNGGWCYPGYSLRPNQVADPAAGQQSGLLWFNPSAFVPSPAGEYGSAPVAPFRLPGRQQWDFSVSKRVGLTSGIRLQIRADLLNAFNQVQYLDVNTTCGATTTCDPRNGFGQVTSARPPRQFQLGARVEW